jgi:hypothetical protein
MSSPPAPREDGTLPATFPLRSLEIFSTGASAALFFAVFLVLPIAGLLALPLAMATIVRLAHRRGTVAALAASGIVGALILLLGRVTDGYGAAFSGAVFAATLTGLPALFAGSVHRGADPSHASIGLCAAGFALACLFLLARPGGSDAAMRAEIDRAFDEWLRLSAEPGRPAVDPETSARVRTTLDAARVFTRRFWVGLIGVCWVLASAVGFYAGAWAGRPAPSAQATRFERFRVPAGVVALFVASGAGWALLPPPADRVAGNLLWPLLTLYFVAGLSIICHFARRWFRTRILRVGLYALSVYVPINVGVALLGLFDWYADFRQRGREINES